MKLHIKTILAILLSAATVLSLCACDTEIKSEGSQVQTGQHSAVAGLSSTETNQDTATSQPAPVDTVAFNEYDYYTWFFAERTDFVTPEAAAEIKEGMRWSDVVALLGKPQFDYMLETELRFFPANYVEGKIVKWFKQQTEDSIVYKACPVYKLTDGSFLCVFLLRDSDTAVTSRYFMSASNLEIVDDLENISRPIGWYFAAWYASEEKNSKKYTPEEFEKFDGMVYEEAYKAAGKPWGYISGSGSFVYILTDGSYMILANEDKIVGGKRIKYARTVLCTGYLYLDPDVGEQVEVFIDSKTGELVKRTTYDKIELERKTIS